MRGGRAEVKRQAGPALLLPYYPMAWQSAVISIGRLPRPIPDLRTPLACWGVPCHHLPASKLECSPLALIHRGLLSPSWCFKCDPSFVVHVDLLDSLLTKVLL